jgi:predicted esterase
MFLDEFAERLQRRYGPNATLINPDGPAAWEKIRRWRQLFRARAMSLGAHELDIEKLILAIETNEAAPCPPEFMDVLKQQKELVE